MPVLSQLRKVAFIGDYVPRRCGIATFTADLRNAVAGAFNEIQCPVVAVTDRTEGYPYPAEVRFDFPEQELQGYRRAADFLNLANPDVVCLQHEYGIYGGPCGSHLLTFLRNVRAPIVTTLHTVLKEPSEEQRKMLVEVVRHSTKVVTMAERGVEFLTHIYGVPPEKIELIPHGIPDIPFVDPNYYKDQFGVLGRPVILTFGLLSPNKGIEYMIEALSAIAAEFPDVVYMVLGATHPNLMREQGETYRLSLERLAKRCGVERNVIFFNRFVNSEELVEFLGAADIYVTPYLNEAQITSGTLAFSFGTGKAVVSTPYWHAGELLDQGRGVIVPFRDSAALAAAVTGLLRDSAMRHAMRKQAYLLGREMVWPNVARTYVRLFERARLGHSPASRSAGALTFDTQEEGLPPWRLEHLMGMTDDTGIVQHAIYTLRDYHHGYCTDDNARALILTTLLEDLETDFPDAVGLGRRYAAFLQNAFVRGSGRFRNFLSHSRVWLEDFGSEDSHGRALWALGTCVGRSKQNALRSWAAGLFEASLPVVASFQSPRAWAFTVLGLHEYLRTLSGDRLAQSIREDLASRLLSLFDRVADDDWKWFEDIVAYDNAKIPHALILSGRWTNQPRMLEVGLTSLRWLAERQTAPEGHFRPVGSNGWWKRGEEPAWFDQQPIEAHAMLCAAIEAHDASGDPYWMAMARRAFDWFLGANDLGLSLYDAGTGGCRDGLHVDRVNENQGAESTLAYLLSRAELQRYGERINLHPQ
ncbi:MAG: glycosyltransferase family 4 protein [Terrimicrobiaceae bacterium]